VPAAPPSAPSAELATPLGTGAGAYLRLLRHRPARGPFLAAMIARLPLSMAPLGILLLVESERGTYTLAGLVTGAYAVGSALGTPLWGRLMDRFGQVRVLAPTALASASLVTALALATVSSVPPPVVLGVLAVLAGFCYPAMSPALRAAWRTVFPDRESRRVAYALDATSVELIFVGGPLLLSLLLAVSPPVVPLLATAAAMAGGTLAYCRTDAARRSRPLATSVGSGGADRTGIPGPRSAITATGVGAMLLVMLGLSIGFGQLDTSMAATAEELLGSTEKVGFLFLAIAGGSTAGGLVFGSRSWSFDERRAVPVLLVVFAVMLAVMAGLMTLAAPPLWALFPLLVVTGATIAPILIMQQALLDHLAPAHRLNEAQAFLSAANTTGAAAGTAIAGVLIDYRGLDFSFGGAAAGAAAAALVALLSQSRWRRASAAKAVDAEEPAPVG
jgi:MFS family permease